MKEVYYNQVLHNMSDVLDADGLMRLNEVLNAVFYNVEFESKCFDLVEYQDDWRNDLDDFITSKTLEGRSQKTLDRYEYELNRLLQYINRPIKEIESDDISNFLRLYKSTKNVSNQTLKNVRAIYSSFFQWAFIKNRIRTNPSFNVEKIKVEDRIKNGFSEIEREKINRNCENIRDRAIVEFLYSTGVRVSEMQALNISDINFSTKDMVVYGKGNKERIVYLNDKSYMYLREYLNTRTDDNPALFVWNKPPYKRLSKSGIENVIRHIGKEAEIHAYPHRFRRTAATNALNRGMPVQEVSKFLGHSKLETTMMYCTIEQDSVRYHHKKYLNS